MRSGTEFWYRQHLEHAADSVVPYSHDLAISYEDDDYLIVNKPAGVASIPAVGRQNNSMANMVKAYLIKTKAESQAVHVVTRLDRDTSGLMVFAKHGLAHSLLDQQLHSQDFVKQYVAIVTDRTNTFSNSWLDRIAHWRQ